MAKIKRLSKLAVLFMYDLVAILMLSKNSVPIKYYSAKKNVGDALNVYLVGKVSGRRVLEIKSGWFKHVLPVGSIMHFGTPKSIAWGTGIIAEEKIPHLSVLKKMRFAAVRGKKTRALLNEKLGTKLNCPMGDPAVLMPLFYTPKTQKQYSFGIVPHYVDKETSSFSDFASTTGAKIIDVELPVEEFLDQLAECDVVASSSLHGLILADSYNIPNLWVRFSDGVIGGDFKFLDYYSTTDAINPSPLDVRNSVSGESLKLEDLISKAKVANYLEDRDLLTKAFPSRL